MPLGVTRGVRPPGGLNRKVSCSPVLGLWCIGYERAPCWQPGTQFPLAVRLNIPEAPLRPTSDGVQWWAPSGGTTMVAHDGSPSQRGSLSADPGERPVRSLNPRAWRAQIRDSRSPRTAIGWNFPPVVPPPRGQCQTVSIARQAVAARDRLRGWAERMRSCWNPMSNG